MWISVLYDEVGRAVCCFPKGEGSRRDPVIASRPRRRLIGWYRGPRRHRRRHSARLGSTLSGIRATLRRAFHPPGEDIGLQ